MQQNYAACPMIVGLVALDAPSAPSGRPSQLSQVAQEEDRSRAETVEPLRDLVVGGNGVTRG